MEKKQFGYSTKNIGIPSKKEYSLELISSINQFVRRLRWRANFFKNPDLAKTAKETYNFRSLNAPPPVPELKPLETGLYNLVKNLKFRKTAGNNNFQQKLRKDLSEVRSEKKLFVPLNILPETMAYYHDPVRG